MVTRSGVAGVAVAALLLTALAVPREGGFAAAPERLTVREYPVPAGSHPHDVAPARDGTVWYTGQHTGELGRLDPRTGAIRRVPLGAGSSPHGVIVGPGRRGVGYRQRAELDRPGRPGHASGAAVPASDLQVREPEHGHLRSARHPLVHGTERRVRQRRSTNGESARVLSAARRRSVRHRDDAVRCGLLRVARGEPHRADRYANGARNGAPASHARPGRAPRLVGLEEPGLGERVERGQGRAPRARHAPLARVAAARAQILSRTRSTWTTATSSG